MLYVEAIDILHKNSIRLTDIDRAERILTSFVEQFQNLYGLNRMTFNIHALLHLAEYVRKFGPLHNYSLFVFENFNGILNKCITGPNEPLMQIVIRLNCYFNIELKNEYRRTVNEFNSKTMFNVNTRRKCTNTNKRFKMFTYADKAYQSYTSYFINNVTICTADHSAKYQYNDSVIYMNRHFRRIVRILRDDKNDIHLLCETVNVRSFESIYNYYEILGYNEARLVKLDTVFTKCFVVDFEGRPALSHITNILIIN
jgi:hypothetical protein